MREDKKLQEQLSRRGYELCRLAGKGGTSSVYLVREKSTGNYYACKVGACAELICKEGELAGRLRHPLFPKGKEYWQEEMGFFVMEYVEGSVVLEKLEKGVRFSVQSTVRIALELSDALSYLHEQNPPIYYRDLKPGNIAIAPDGRVRLLDLGAAVSLPGTRVGTPGYAAPEQFMQGGKVGEESDVYTLARVMYTMITGLLSPKEDEELFFPGDIRVPAKLKYIIRKSIRPCPGERIPGMRELRESLKGLEKARGPELIWQEITFFLKRKERKALVYEKNIWKSAYKTDIYLR